MATPNNRFEISTHDSGDKRPIGECVAEIASTLWGNHVKEPLQDFLARKDVHQVNQTYALSKPDHAMFDAYADA
jgi:hypothetical protein